MEDFKIMKLNILANIARIDQLLSDDYIEYRNVKIKCTWDKERTYIGINQKNVELRQRLKLLRKDTLQVEKLFKN